MGGKTSCSAAPGIARAPGAWRWRPIALLALILVTIALHPDAAAQGRDTGPSDVHRPILPGIGAADPRVMGDPKEKPWRGIGKLQTTAGALYASCTATLIKPALLLTAAHCLFNHRTGNYFLASMMHFLLSFDRGNYVAHALGVDFVIGPGFDPVHPRETAGSDWALLAIDQKLGTPDRLVALGDPRPAVGTAVTIGGYGQDHPYKLMIDRRCQIVARGIDSADHLLLRHDCTATRGVSGAPLLARDGDQWQIIGVDVAAEMGVASGIAVGIGAVRDRLKAE